MAMEDVVSWEWDGSASSLRHAAVAWVVAAGPPYRLRVSVHEHARCHSGRLNSLGSPVSVRCARTVCAVR